MAVNHVVMFRVSKEQLERIRFDAKAKGYSTPSAYLRHLALKRDYFLETKIVEMSKDIKQITEMIKCQNK